MTVAVKDMFDIRGASTSGGSPAWRDAHPPAAANSGAVQRLLDAGASVVGKTVADEFFYSTVGTNAHFGTPLNPHAVGRIPGGSSSGSASASASGACDFAIGSDTAGSVRVPAALCGVYGIRASRDRFDFTGAMKMAPSFDAGGWFAATPGVFRMVGRILLQGVSVPGAIERVVLLDDALEVADPAIAKIVEDVVFGVEEKFSHIGRTRSSTEGLEVWREAMRVVQAWEVWDTFGDFVRSESPELGPGVRERLILASRIGEEEMRAARRVLHGVTERMEALAPVGTVLALPTTPVVAPTLNEEEGSLESYRVNGMRLSCIASISGLPQVTIPMAYLDGAPVGVSFIGWRGGDEQLLDLAVAMSPLAASLVRTSKSAAVTN
ncbi:amidase [Arthrobacter bambusae]|nr:amidase [Arthrobacter bambusae]